MDAERNPEYLRALATAVSQFKEALQSFVELHVDVTESGIGRGMMPAVMRKEGVDEAEVERRKSTVALAAGRIAAVAPVVGMYVQVQGAGTTDPFSAWLTITPAKAGPGAGEHPGRLRPSHRSARRNGD